MTAGFSVVLRGSCLSVTIVNGGSGRFLSVASIPRSRVGPRWGSGDSSYMTGLHLLIASCILDTAITTAASAAFHYH